MDGKLGTSHVLTGSLDDAVRVGTSIVQHQDDPIRDDGRWQCGKVDRFSSQAGGAGTI